MVLAGRMGRKSGRGFYNYPNVATPERFRFNRQFLSSAHARGPSISSRHAFEVVNDSLARLVLVVDPDIDRAVARSIDILADV